RELHHRHHAAGRRRRGGQPMTTVRYGLIGLGNVGTDLTVAAVASGLDLHVFDIDPAARGRAQEAGARVHDDAVGVAREADVLVLSLPNAEIVDAVLADGVLEALRPGSLLIDMSTNLPENAETM